MSIRNTPDEDFLPLMVSALHIHMAWGLWWVPAAEPAVTSQVWWELGFQSHLWWILIATTVFALIGCAMQHVLWRSVALLPQQIILFVSAMSVVYAIHIGSYPYGRVPITEGVFISRADSIWIALCVAHLFYILYGPLVWIKAWLSQIRREQRNGSC